MKKLSLSLLLIIVSLFSNSQSVLEFDNMETSSTLYAPAGWWTPAVTTGWYNNASVTPTLSAVIYGSGSGTSGNEQDWYSLPNKTGLNPTRQYQLKFRLASYSFSNSTATTRGVDVGDFIEVQLSTNGGVNYISELRITGNNNAQWPYTSTGTITHTANGSFTNSAAPTGDVYQAPSGVTTTGPTFITLNLPSGISQIAIDIFCRANSNGEEWWLDNIELWDITPTPLPVELISFEATSSELGNLITWKTASEYNSDYYLLESSRDGEKYSVINKTTAAGFSNQIMEYNFVDKNYLSNITYYRLVQYDWDGESDVYGPITVNNTTKVKKVVGIFNMLGQPVTEIVSGNIYIEVYDDGTTSRFYK